MKIKKTVSVISVLCLAGMLVLYFYALPEFFLSAKGKVFAIFWLSMAALTFGAHSLRLLPQRKLSGNISQEISAASLKEARGKKIPLKSRGLSI